MHSKKCQTPSSITLPEKAFKHCEFIAVAETTALRNQGGLFNVQLNGVASSS